MTIEVAVIGVTNADGLTKPHAFVRSNKPVEATELQQHVKDHLAPHKYPRVVTFVHEFPHTHLGKIDRGALRRRAEEAL